MGKSTLFNYLTRSRDALVADFSGLTRDRQYGRVKLGDRPCLVVDTGGIADDAEGIESFARKQVQVALEELKDKSESGKLVPARRGPVRSGRPFAIAGTGLGAILITLIVLWKAGIFGGGSSDPSEPGPIRSIAQSISSRSMTSGGAKRITSSWASLHRSPCSMNFSQNQRALG